MGSHTESKPGQIGPMLLRLVWLALAVVLVVFSGQAAQAQTVTQYSNSSDSANGGINDTSAPCTARFTRTFSVGSSFTVSDVNIAVLMSHTWRSDIRMYLVSPAGTRIQLTNEQGADADNFNLTFDDEASNAIANYVTNSVATSTTTVPPYATSYRPSSPLSGFDGQNSSGTWILEICDAVAQDFGTFYQADLYLTSAPANYADLSLTKTVNNSAPAFNGSITYTLTVTNSAASNLTSIGVTVRDLLPSGINFSSYLGTGTYNSTTGDWSVGTLAPGQSSSLTITATVAAGGGATVVNGAEITTSSVLDLDSAPGNGLSGEDDYASASITVSGTNTAGTPPALTCAAGSSLVNWDVNTWSAGLRSNSYAISGLGTVAFAVTTSGSGDPTLAGVPVTSTSLTGGAATPQNNLYLGYDFFTQSQEATVKITLPSAVPGAQFRIFDVDYGANSWADHITITGTINGASVLPTLTNGISNWISGNEAFGISGSSNTQSNGNLTVTFNSPVDTIYVSYGNHSAAPSNPQGQVIGIDDITLCKPVASISVTKVSLIISDPVNGTSFPKAIPGALVEYCILVSNTGTATLANIAANDTLPANFNYAAGTMSSGNTCATANTPEDDDGSGVDETDPFGAAIVSSSLSATASSLSASTSFALKFRGTLN
ncbi:MAG: proprotein convertase P-domain-containing protein [Novosphingobium sp.]|uniref:proprotein convertase P-domain-containing protein n=1 Tax=Novosphingobium sp. TaxID=1874826 RepID=UPI0032BA9E03